MLAAEVQDAALAKGGRTVLQGVDFAIAPGEFVGLFGANGSGKTTLLRALAGLERPRQGAIRVFGEAARPGNPLVAAMPQSTAAPAARLTGWEYVASAAATEFGSPLLPREARRAAASALELVDAADLARRPLAELSGGERQRVLLAQALMGRPRLLLLDEPLASLDPRHQAGIVSLVRRLQEELGLAVLFSAHDLNPLLPVMDRVVTLGGGRAAAGAVGDVVTGPALSALYGAEVEVVRAGGRLFVLFAGADAAATSPPEDAARVRV